MWKWCPEDTYTQLDEIWNGQHPEDGQELVVRDEMPPAFPWPQFPEEPQLCPLVSLIQKCLTITRGN
jgi:hypothetical protein